MLSFLYFSAILYLQLFLWENTSAAQPAGITASYWPPHGWGSVNGFGRKCSLCAVFNLVLYPSMRCFMAKGEEGSNGPGSSSAAQPCLTAPRKKWTPSYIKKNIYIFLKKVIKNHYFPSLLFFKILWKYWFSGLLCKVRKNSSGLLCVSLLSRLLSGSAWVCSNGSCAEQEEGSWLTPSWPKLITCL